MSNIIKVKMTQKQSSTRKIAAKSQKQYDHTYYEKNKERIRQTKLEEYYQHRYCISANGIEEFKRNRKVYTSLKDCDPNIVCKMLKISN
jgi:hypothetical protein